MIYLCGDPHGGFDQIEQAAECDDEGDFVLLGDYDLRVPMEQAIPAAADRAWWIAGNHEGDSPENYDNAFKSALAGRNLHARVADIGGLRFAGLGGVFRGKIWYPGQSRRFETREEFVKAMKPAERWRGGLSVRHRVSIWPEEFEAMRTLRADVLVCHEAPLGLRTQVRGGFDVIGELAVRMGAKLIVHGHHHKTYEDVTPQGVAIQGVGIRQVVEIDPAMLDSVARRAAEEFVMMGGADSCLPA